MATPESSAEQRGDPRYQRLLPVRVRHLDLTTANVSLHGLQVVCPIMRFESIKADARRGELVGLVSLPDGSSIDAALSVRYCSQYGDDVLIGVKLTIAYTDAQARWAAYIDSLSRGRDPSSSSR